MKTLPILLLATLSLGLGGAPASAAPVEKSARFELGAWVPLETTDGPVTLHRLRIVRQEEGLTKSKLFRPGNDEYLATVQIQLEYSNTSTDDWEAVLDLRWLDAEGRTIDGYRDEENLDSEERHGIQTVTLSTLQYGLERARKLVVRARVQPD